MRSNCTSLYDWCMASGNEEILKRWNYELNSISPKDISRASHQSVWWHCDKHNHNYENEIQRITIGKVGCPLCANEHRRENFTRYMISQNGSVADRDWMMRRWDFDKNTVNPSEIPIYYKEKVWWVCPTCGNSYDMKPSYLKENYLGCKRCNGNKFYFLGQDGSYAVYCHTTPDGKKYIGMTNMPIKTRFGKGNHYPTPRFKAAIDRFGWNNIEHEVLEYGLTREQASESEIKYINQFNTLNPDYGYNVATGGIHGYVPDRTITKETKLKLSIAHQGMKASAQTRKKLSDSHKGLDNHQSKSVFKLSLDGQVIDEYDSLKIAAIDNGISNKNAIIDVCKGRRETAGGYKWKYK